MRDCFVATLLAKTKRERLAKTKERGSQRQKREARNDKNESRNDPPFMNNGGGLLRRYAPRKDKRERLAMTKLAMMV